MRFFDVSGVEIYGRVTKVLFYECGSCPTKREFLLGFGLLEPYEATVQTTIKFFTRSNRAPKRRLRSKPQKTSTIRS